MRYWLSAHRDHDGGLGEQSIRIEWVDANGREHTACGDLRGASIAWTQDSGSAVPERLASLAAACAIDAYEYGVEGCSFEGQETANEMWIAVDDHIRPKRRTYEDWYEDQAAKGDYLRDMQKDGAL